MSDQTSRHHIAASIKAEMARNGLTQAQVAEHIGRSRVWLGERLLCQRAFDTDSLYRISDLLGVSMTDLFPGETESIAS